MLPVSGVAVAADVAVAVSAAVAADLQFGAR